MTAQASEPIVASVPKLWPGSTVAILATGPSLVQADVDYCRGRAKVIAIKDAIRLAPWADVLYACGSDTGNWWPRNGDSLQGFSGLRYTLDPKAAKWATVLRNTGFVGLETDPTGLRTGKNSGYQSIGLACHLGAQRIVLLGYNMEGNSHFFGPHPDRYNRPNYREFSQLFETLVEPLLAIGVETINCSRETTVTAFPRRTLAEALA